MSRVNDLKKQIQELSPEELTAFREWFTKFDPDTGDKEVDADVKGGTLDTLAERALRDRNTGRSTKL